MRNLVIGLVILLSACGERAEPIAAPAPLFRDLVSGEALDAQIAPSAFAVAKGAKEAGPSSSDWAVKRDGFEKVLQGLGGAPEALAAVEIIEAPRADGGAIPIHLYRPATEGLAPVLVFFHGGGFEKGSTASHAAAIAAIANACACVVASVDYRLAPEHKYPAAPDDAYAALDFLYNQAAQYGLDASRLAVGGNSVGGNLAAVTALRVRDEQGPSLRAQVLINPVTDVRLETESWKRYADGPLLSRAYELNALSAQYLPEQQSPTAPYVSPLLAPSHAGLPPALVITAQFDGYRDEGVAYAEALQAAGALVEAETYPGQIHDFFLMLQAVPDDSRRAVAQIGTFLKARFQP